MRFRTLYIVMFLAIVTTTGFAQNKHALIFAIGDYPANSGWPKISSDNDVALIQNALSVQNFKDIKVVSDAAATADGISAALEDLISRSKPGDIDVIHFSSHGEQVEDLKKHKADGLEECIVAYDAKLPDPKAAYTRAYFLSLLPGYYREDKFGSYVDKLRAKLGKTGDLVVFMDLCHAGTGTRGSAKVRGGHGALVSPGFELGPDTTDIATAFSNSSIANSNDDNLATYVVFGAARADELDYETIDEFTHKGYGSLSYAISKVFLNLPKERNSQVTYRALFGGIQSIMDDNAANQHPVLAGNGADRLLFGGKVVVQKPFIEIGALNGDHITLKGGNLMGLDSGAKVGVYPAGTLDPRNAKLIAAGTVTSAGLFTSDVSLGKAPELAQPADGWVFVTAPVFKDNPVNIAIATGKINGTAARGTFSQAENLRIKKELKSIPGVVFSGTPGLKIAKGELCDSILIANTGLLFDTIRSATLDTAAFRAKITHYQQYVFLKNVTFKDTDALVDIRLIPVINGRPDSAKMRSKDNTYTFKNGDQFRLMVTNKSMEDLYVNILDLQPNGLINAVLPNRKKNIEPGELLFPAGSSKLFPNTIKISPPYGKETFKIFVSADMIDMESIAGTHGARSAKGNLSALEKLVSKSYEAGTRGAEDEEIEGSAYNLVFDIVR